MQNAVLWRTLEEHRRREREDLGKVEQKARKRARAARRATRTKRREAKAKAAADKAERARLRQLAALPLAFSVAEAGHKMRGIKVRSEALERMHLNSPPRPPDLEPHWIGIRNRYARFFPHLHTLGTGEAFVDLIHELQTRPCHHYRSRTRFNGVPREDADPEAFARFVRRAERQVPGERRVLM